MIASRSWFREIVVPLVAPLLLALMLLSHDALTASRTADGARDAIERIREQRLLLEQIERDVRTLQQQLDDPLERRERNPPGDFTPPAPNRRPAPRAGRA